MMGKTVNILWLYDELLDLYGDSGNILLLRRRIEGMGYECSVKTVGLGDEIDFSGVDMVYVGPGKHKNLKAAAEHIVKYKDELKAYIDNDGLVLATGSSQVLFGKEYDGVECAGIFDYTAIETGNVNTDDIVAYMADKPNALCYGFVNRTSYLSDESSETPAFKIHESTYSKDFPANTEGRIKNNFYGTWMLGPVLVKNPDFAKMFLKKLLGEDFVEYDDALERKALKFTVEEFINEDK